MSNLIKNLSYIPVEDKKTIHIVKKVMPPVKSEQVIQAENKDNIENENAKEFDEIKVLKDKIIKDAEAYAEKQIKQSKEEASKYKANAEKEISDWWEEKRKQDEQHVETAKKQGYELGYKDGVEKATADVQDQYFTQLEEAKRILEAAHIQKQEIIQEAEPFLIELSCEIAKKIIHKQLSISEEWVVEIIKKSLVRKREKGLITLCVSPAYFQYFLDSQDELALAIDSQAELQIIPDGTIQDYGCVIRSSLGSIDARIDTQLTEVKNALLQIALRSKDDVQHD